LESLFFKVQDIVNTKRKITCKSDELSASLFLKSFLTCPDCGRKLRGSFSKGRSKKYSYYHCSKGCKIRIRAELLNDNYNNKLKQLLLSDNAKEIFQRVLNVVNVSTEKSKCVDERKLLLKELENQQLLISRARRLFVSNKLKFEDFREVKKECQLMEEKFGMELSTNTTKLRRLDQKFKTTNIDFIYVFNRYSELATDDKKLILSMISPVNVNIKNGDLSLRLNSALSKILVKKSYNVFELIDSDDQSTSFTDKKYSIRQAISTLAKSNIIVNDSEAKVILQFLYVAAKTYSTNVSDNSNDLKWTSNRQKTSQIASSSRF
jgi:site-specific DNA recombinase